MRIGVAGLLHESNTFAGTQTTRQHFEEAFLHQGADLIPVWREAHHELGGFIEGCGNAEVVPLLDLTKSPVGRRLSRLKPVPPPAFWINAVCFTASNIPTMLSSKGSTKHALNKPCCLPAFIKAGELGKKNRFDSKL